MSPAISIHEGCTADPSSRLVARVASGTHPARRSRRRPHPGHELGNVENRRCIAPPYAAALCLRTPEGIPQKSLFRVW